MGPLRPPKSHSISALESTHGMWYASTRCFPAPVLIDSRPVCVTLTERPFSRPLVSTSDQCSSPSALLPKRCPSLVRPSVAQSSSSPEDRPCSCPGSSDSPKLSTLISRDSSRITRPSPMILLSLRSLWKSELIILVNPNFLDTNTVCLPSRKVQVRRKTDRVRVQEVRIHQN